MDVSNSEEPWYLTIVRMQGIQFIRPAKSWRPIVSVTMVDREQTLPETVLGCDGQNPNLKIPISLHDVDETTRLDIKVWHKPHSKKKSRKRHLIGSAFLSLGGALEGQGHIGSDLSLQLKLPQAKMRTFTIRGTRQSNCTALILRLRSPQDHSKLESPSSSTLISPSSRCDEEFSDDGTDLTGLQTPTEPEEPWECPENILPDSSISGLKKRRRRPKIRGYCVGSSDEDPDVSDVSETDYSLSRPPSPPHMNFPYIQDIEEDQPWDPTTVDPMHHQWDTGSACEDSSPQIMPILPQHTGQVGENEESLSLMEVILDKFSPYREMSDPLCDSGVVLRRLLTEWYAVGASLLALATLNAAVFGYSAGTLYEIDGFALRSVTFGSITAAIGLVADVWFLFLYSSVDVAKFENRARDVYNGYLFFCLTCRFPTLCLLVSTCSLTSFLLVVAWDAWPTAVLIMCCAAGTFLTLQYLIFGCHRAVNFIIWGLQGLCRWGWSLGSGGTGAQNESHPSLIDDILLAPLSDKTPRQTCADTARESLRRLLPTTSTPCIHSWVGSHIGFQSVVGNPSVYL
ncbi:hypothetical protein PHLCEN_2v12045 [Hermanssonia centrifuga]|uniref:Uncharacterized protein n=1 Tax=Hermanssonia centrifuga TaxID=98765 RepID=A0A2R6NI57_9APHY|nr:hypothetical protein PHLCEN_2v12045 [Hermanssonia centrifuga]